MKRIACSGIGLVLSLGLLGLPAGAQDQTQSSSSLGDYARQVRKSPGGATKQKVFDNDNLPTNDKLSIVGPTPASESPTEKPADSASGTPAASESKSPTEIKQPDGGRAPEAKPADAKDAKASEVKPPDSGKPATDDKAQSASTAKPAAKADEDEATKQAAQKQWTDKIESQKKEIDLLTRELDVLQREYQIRAAAMYADAGNRMRNQADWDKQDAQYKQQIADKQKALEDAKQALDDMSENARKAGVSVGEAQ